MNCSTFLYCVKRDAIPERKSVICLQQIYISLVDFIAIYADNIIFLVPTERVLQIFIFLPFAVSVLLWILTEKILSQFEHKIIIISAKYIRHHLSNPTYLFVFLIHC